MEKRALGSTGLQVSILGFGASHIGSDGCSEAEAERVLNRVLDAGINFLDTARGYGKSEERIGKLLGHRRADFVLSTKGGYGVEGVPDWTGDCITRGVEQALRLMRTDVIDVMHLHSCPQDTLRRWEVVEALLAAKRAGKIRAAAYSGENADRAFAIECGAFDVIQTSVNICDQRVIAEALPLTQEKQIGVIAKRPIANAFWRHAGQPHGDYSEVYWLRNQAMQLSPAPLSWTEFALRFTAFKPGVGTCIVGTANMAHLEENIRQVANGPLPTELVEKTRAAFLREDRDWMGQV